MSIGILQLRVQRVVGQRTLFSPCDVSLCVCVCLTHSCIVQKRPTLLRKQVVKMVPFLRMCSKNFAKYVPECCQITTISIPFRTRCKVTMYSSLVVIEETQPRASRDALYQLKYLPTVVRITQTDRLSA